MRYLKLAVIDLVHGRITLGSLIKPARQKAIFCLIVGLTVWPFVGEAQEKVFPHLQIFLVSSAPASRLPFIAFWGGAHKLQAGPFPLKLLERAGFNVSLDLTYPKTTDKLPSAARLKIQKHDNASPQEPTDLVVLDQPADFIAARGVSKMFPDGPFLVIGHEAPSERILRLGRIMGEIQEKLLACDKNYRGELETLLNALRGEASYKRVLKTVESNFPSCRRQTP